MHTAQHECILHKCNMNRILSWDVYISSVPPRSLGFCYENKIAVNMTAAAIV